MIHPAATIADAPHDISEARVWVDSRATDAGADVYVEADCPDAASAQADADAITKLIKHKNSFAVRVMTAGLLNNVEVTTVEAQVRLHVRASQQQIDSIIALASSTYGASSGP